MSNYLSHLEQLYDPHTFDRKIAYLKYNLRDLLNNLPKNAAVLEIGPGIGEFVSLLNQNKISNIDLIDNDQAVLNYLDKKFKIKKTIFSTNISQLKSKLREYDLVVMIQVLEHLPTSQHQAVVKLLFNRLKDNGTLVIVVPNGSNPLSVVERYSDLQHTCIFSEQSLRDLILTLQLKNYSYQITGYEIPPVNILNIFRLILQKVLHKVLKAILIINGGVYFKTMTPNIMLLLKRHKWTNI